MTLKVLMHEFPPEVSDKKAVKAYVRKYWNSVVTAYKERKRWVNTANRTKRDKEARDKEAREKRKMMDREISSVALSSAQKARQEAERTVEDQERREKIAKKVAKDLVGKDTNPWEEDPREATTE